MFETAELGHKLDKAIYRQEEPGLRQALLEAQYELKQRSEFAVVILINGVDGAGKGETVNLLNEWMDPRLIQTHAFGAPSDEESDRPRMWRYWRALPPKGRVGILFGSWYSEPILQRVSGDIKAARFEQENEEIVRFEKMLVHEGVLLFKFWFHLAKDRQKKRLKELEKDPRTRWRVTDADWEHFKHYDEFREVSEKSLLKTSSAEAPWVVIDGEDTCYRSLTVGRLLLAGIRKRLDQPDSRVMAIEAAPLLPPLDKLYLLDRLTLNQTMEKADYERELEAWQGKLNTLSRHPAFTKRSVVAVFEGHDAAGKGGAIRRLTAALDARQYQVVPIAAPTEEERAQPYLWRFWRHLPRRGRLTIFDRSWYGRVLVERVEGFCAEADWMRAYAEINDFEREMVENGVIVVKFWLAIDQDEQLKRFNEREQIEFKRFKITEEDWRNREKWGQYAVAVHDMVDRTSTSIAPWTLVEANNKLYARIKILKTLCKAIESALAAPKGERNG
ncbi:polyphosphate:AMP phosphotransferase [Parachitinimonas caeni]|uniref:Polyphosphate:AMP phosphotransferase n=1 Tax=Parachitinimonas caeni TaxID=3031301 RepID=A0ABT7DU56_9NEIS|nr:polyphosphate:AMP phosphotransferase [Parachitinimonas caeni]MDK2123605.1 polyphosphate:AMP phosphotransferase [Parachitinimonas caeni]